METKQLKKVKKLRMAYYISKMTWKEPKPGTDQIRKITKQFLIYAESCTEAELRLNKWTPANYQDAVVDEVKKTLIQDIKVVGSAETFFLVKILDDNDGRQKPKPFFSVVNGLNLEEAIKKINTDYAFTEIVAIQKFQVVVDEDLTSL
jgi:hypothetical protein